MKNLSLTLNAVLLIAVAILFYLHFNSQPKESQQTATVSSGVPGVAYVDTDTLLKYYDYWNDISDELRKKATQLEEDYKNREQGLQNEARDFQQNAQNLTIAQANALRENLLQKQQNLQLYGQNLNQQLIAEETKYNVELNDKVTDFLEDYGKNNNLDLIVKYSRGSDVMYAADTMNITKIVIDGLNEQYKKSKETEQSTEKEESKDQN